MKSNKVNYAAVGSFVLAILAGLIISVAMLTGRTGATDTYFAVYDNVTNVKYGTQVMFEGYPVGQVENIRPLKQDGKVRFRVDMSVLQGWKIPDNSIAQITSSGLLAAITIVIKAGSSQAMLSPGDEITASGRKSMFEAISSVAGETTGLIHRLRDIANNFAGKAPEITRNLTEFTAKLNKSGSQLQEFLKQENARHLESALTSFAELSENLKATRERLDNFISDSSSLVSDNRGDLKDAVGNLRHTMASISQHIDAISHNLEIASRNMNEFSRQISANPGVLLNSKPPADEAVQ